MAKTFDEWWSENSGKSLDCSRKTVAMLAWGAAAEQAARAAGEEREKLEAACAFYRQGLEMIAKTVHADHAAVENHANSILRNCDEGNLLLARFRVQVERAEKAEKFKAYVHRRLDEAGVPADPDSPHKAEGCRIGGRLDIVLSRSPGEPMAWIVWMPEGCEYEYMMFADKVEAEHEVDRHEDHLEPDQRQKPTPLYAPPSPVAGGPGAAERSGR
jgi:hypothetical protein